MSSNDKSKTSKTARVMNLLSKKQTPAPSEQPSGEAPAAGEEVPVSEAAAPVKSSPTPPILNSIGADAAVSNQIKSALEDALEAELTPEPQPEPPQQPQPDPQPEPVQQSQPEPQPEPVQQSQPEPQPDPVPQPQPVPVQPVQAQQSALVIPADEQLGYINVMQVLVEEKAPKYIKMFGLCDCQRCLEDVKALALNHLPPKYVVLAENEMIPKLTFYEGKYSSDITAQLLQACKMVSQRPHHTR